MDQDADLATRYGHLTARQAARVAAEVFGGELVIAEDLTRVAVPSRIDAAPDG